MLKNGIFKLMTHSSFTICACDMNNFLFVCILKAFNSHLISHFEKLRNRLRDLKRVKTRVYKRLGESVSRLKSQVLIRLIDHLRTDNQRESHKHMIVQMSVEAVVRYIKNSPATNEVVTRGRVLNKLISVQQLHSGTQTKNFKF